MASNATSATSSRVLLLPCCKSPAKREAPWSPSLWNRTEERVIGCCDGDDILSYVYII
eukprot:symbB.v1.2.029348.t1/scaffold3183.1/size61800/1